MTEVTDMLKRMAVGYFGRIRSFGFLIRAELYEAVSNEWMVVSTITLSGVGGVSYFGGFPKWTRLNVSSGSFQGGIRFVSATKPSQKLSLIHI